MLPVPFNLPGDPGTFGPCFMEQEGRISSKGQTYQEVNFEILDSFKSVTLRVWLALIGIFASVFFPLFLRNILKIFEDLKSGKKRVVRTMARLLWILLRIILNQVESAVGVDLFSRILIGSVLKLMVIFLAYYNGMVSTNLITVEQVKPVNSLEDVLETEYKVLFVKGDPLTSHFEFGEPDSVFGRIWSRALKQDADDPDRNWLLELKLDPGTQKRMAKYMETAVIIAPLRSSY